MMIDRKLMTEFVARYPAQPATAFWRGIEIDVLAKAGIPDGLGLDLGCGDGILTQILFDRIGRTPRLVGIDPDSKETEAAAKYPFYDRLHTVGGASIPEPDCTFDYAISNSVLEHILDLDPVIAELYRVLKPGGKFFFTVPCPGFHDNLAGSVIPNVSRDRYLADLDRRLAHFHYLSEADWRDVCDRHGLQLLSTAGYLGARATKRWENLSRVTGGALHLLSFGKRRPIEIQRALHLRSFQNSARLPEPVARLLAGTITAGLNWQDRAETPSCLLVIGQRPIGD